MLVTLGAQRVKGFRVPEAPPRPKLNQVTPPPSPGLKCDYSDERYQAVPSCGVVYYAVQGEF